jgi:hypothetical protein
MTTFQAAATQAPFALPTWLRRLVAALTGQRRPAPTLQSLDDGATMWIDRPLGRRIVCESGTLWLAFDGEQDIVLEAGESHLCTKASPLSIHALSAADLRVA